MKKEDVCKKILEMSKKDQEVRKNMGRMKDIDERNRREFKKIFKEVGYISSEYGKDVQLGAFLIVQHMPKEDIPFMKEYLRLMKKDIKNIKPLYYALLTDRVRMYEGKKQMYGTQFVLVDGIYKLHPIANIKNVDIRRKEIGLEPLDEYLNKLSEEIQIENLSKNK
ncbi:MAG: hypothetical protein RBS01_01270 [Candidatus Dojkabacteria bacterium]|nr:hypothetical protein [Candidatus Dojkabacteria bacterium]